MTTRLLLSAVIATCVAFAPAAFAEEMKKNDTPMADTMKKNDNMKKTDTMKKNDNMKKTDNMKKSDEMKK